MKTYKEFCGILVKIEGKDILKRTNLLKDFFDDYRTGTESNVKKYWNSCLSI